MYLLFHGRHYPEKQKLDEFLQSSLRTLHEPLQKEEKRKFDYCARSSESRTCKQRTYTEALAVGMLAIFLAKRNRIPIEWKNPTVSYNLHPGSSFQIQRLATRRRFW
jgi:hypothetical protein